MIKIDDKLDNNLLFGKKMKVNRINNINGYISSTMNYHIKIYFVLIWSKTEFCTKQQQSVLSSSARPRERQRGENYSVGWNMFFSEGILAQGLSSDSSAYSLEALQPVMLPGAGSVCPWWSVQMAAYEETYSHTLNFFFWMHICSSLRIRRAHITGSKGNFLEWYVAQTTS